MAVLLAIMLELREEIRVSERYASAGAVEQDRDTLVLV